MPKLLYLDEDFRFAAYAIFFCYLLKMLALVFKTS